MKKAMGNATKGGMHGPRAKETKGSGSGSVRNATPRHVYGKKAS